uniref:Uncharacterized protein n=1 Tax=Arundo donax TaxID=35708 RepID=A0A0A9FYS1_ARUDO
MEHNRDRIIIIMTHNISGRAI